MQKFALPPLIDSHSKILILGTMPGDQSIARQQYYGNKGNHFWKIIFNIFGESYNTNYEERKELLKKHRIALWNVLASCVREGSSDSKIKNECANDFENLHLQYPNIRHIFFESKTAAKFFGKYANPNDGITYHILPSTSGLNAGLSLTQKIEMWKKLAETAKTLQKKL
ncbi:DNA-deoxyinosine glycosylase [Flavobacterium piscis]|uniref:Hypoxanthine-DNA glycosylase n=1 Tax=Flavobacterium piscis TaxID=1114874 RepID=A0ABU1YBM3_9FLAO|nr:DNA-deoxyinosine glycosylase [Flavobacterium piscis]MDR7211639.1 hypoxanthine-DNA glycosylase [Flavobacterium piscis]